MAPREWTLRTRFEPEVCAQRLKARINSDYNWFGSKPAQGTVGRGWARLRKQIGYRNSFQTVMDVSMTPARDHTLLSCRVGLSPFVWAFAFVWVGFLGLLWLGGLTDLFLNGVGADGGGLVFVLFPLGMIGFGAALLAFGRWLARDEATFLLAFVRETLEADLVNEAG